MSKRALAYYLGFLVVTALGLLPRWVHAQTITINTGSQATELVDANHNPVSHSYQPATSQVYWVNLAECKLNWVYQISVTTLGMRIRDYGSVGRSYRELIAAYGIQPIHTIRFVGELLLSELSMRRAQFIFLS